jgi:sarcosine oxidase, subunit gamma
MSKLGQINIRAVAPSTIEALESHLGMLLPKKPNTSTASETQTLLWLAPDEWLLLTDYTQAHQTTAALKACLSEHSGAIINLSDNRVQLTLSGPDSHARLQQGTAIDIPKLNPGDVVQTLFAKTQMIIHCLAPLSYQLLVRTSFETYTETFLGRYN